MYNYGLGYCAPCAAQPSMAGLGTIVMQPLRGGLSDGEVTQLSMQEGLMGSAGVMLGGGLAYGAVTGATTRSWRGAATGGLMGAGLIGLMLGGSMAMMGSDPASPVAPQSGIPTAIVGGALLAWGAYRAYKKKA